MPHRSHPVGLAEHLDLVVELRDDQHGAPPCHTNPYEGGDAKDDRDGEAHKGGLKGGRWVPICEALYHHFNNSVDLGELKNM